MIVTVVVNKMKDALSIANFVAERGFTVVNVHIDAWEGTECRLQPTAYRVWIDARDYRTNQDVRERIKNYYGDVDGFSLS